MAKIKITKDELTQELLKKLVTYHPSSGILTRNYLAKDMLCYFSAPRFLNEWNAKAGEKVGVINTHRKRSNYKTYQVWLFGTNYIGARLIWLYMKGEWPENHIDHINGDSIDNRWSNLRDVTCQENLRNQRIRKNNKSGKTGVDWNKTHECWQARGSETIDGVQRRIFLGYYDDLDEAIEARVTWEESQGNFTSRHQTVASLKPQISKP